MNVLISLLGLAPGVATGAYYALARDRGVPIQRLVTLTTDHPLIRDCEAIIETELHRWRQETGTIVEYDGECCLSRPVGPLEMPGALAVYRQQIAPLLNTACRLRIPYEEVRTAESVDVFREVILGLLRETYRDESVYLCVAGGRKSMAAVATIVAQIYGHNVQGLYHLYVERELERYGAVDSGYWDLSLEERQVVLRPGPDECTLVELPYLQMRLEDGKPRLTVRGQVDEYTFDYLQQHPPFFELLDAASKDKYWGYLYEVKVADYFRRKKYAPVYHDHKVQGLEIDVYAHFSHERFEKLVICECKARTGDGPDAKPMDTEGVEQLIKRIPLVRQEMETKLKQKGEADKEVRMQAWVVCNVSTALPETIELAAQHDIRLMYGRTPAGWKKGVHWDVSEIRPLEGVR